jgi:hypothetical protein
VRQIGLVAFLIVVLLNCTTASGQAAQVNTQFVLSANDVDLTIDFGNGTVTIYSGLSAPDVYNLTTMVVEVDAIWSGNRAYINAIDGVYQDESHGWQYWVNGNYATVAANLFILEDGDSVLWNRTISGYQSTTESDFTLFTGSILLTVGGFGFLALIYWRTKRRT